MYRILLILIVIAAQICRAQEPTALPDTLKGGEMIFIAKGDSSYYIDKYEVTNAEYAEFLNARGNQQEEGAYWIELRSRFALIEEKEGTFAAKDSFATHPVVEISWYGANAYCQWAGKRLPNQREWRYACEGDEHFKYPWGNTFEQGYANIFGDKYDGYVRTAPVGTYPQGASPFGLMDMAGNVWEWTWAEGDIQFLRGGSWVNGNTLGQCDKRANTKDAHSYVKGNTLGFRCAR
jgi:formylglycine-generating enzyme required for sulfatase activity